MGVQCIILFASIINTFPKLKFMTTIREIYYADDGAICEVSGGMSCPGLLPQLAASFLPRWCRENSMLAIIVVRWYIGTMAEKKGPIVQRVQTGVRMEKRLLKVLKAFADYHDLTLGDLLEGIVLHAFDGKIPFSQASVDQIQELKRFYGLDLNSSASHRLQEAASRRAPRRATRAGRPQ